MEANKAKDVSKYVIVQMLLEKLHIKLKAQYKVEKEKEKEIELNLNDVDEM